MKYPGFTRHDNQLYLVHTPDMDSGESGMVRGTAHWPEKTRLFTCRTQRLEAGIFEVAERFTVITNSEAKHDEEIQADAPWFDTFEPAAMYLRMRTVPEPQS